MSFKLKYNIGNYSSEDLPVYNISNLLDKTFTIDLKNLNSFSFMFKDPAFGYAEISFDVNIGANVVISPEKISNEDMRKGTIVTITTDSQNGVEATVRVKGASRVSVSGQLGKPLTIGTFLVKFINSNIPTIADYEYVDLGLPSGTLWAKCNVGAETETDFGKYFAWGETQGHTISGNSDDGYTISDGHIFNGSTYTYYSSSDTPKEDNGMTKYNTTDGKITLDLEDDAAHVNMGGVWHMPTKEEVNELFNETKYERVTDYNGTGVNGWIFMSIPDETKMLFIPSTGVCNDGHIDEPDIVSTLWTSSLASDDCSQAFYLLGDNKVDPTIGSLVRMFGLPVRGVCKLSKAKDAE